MDKIGFIPQSFYFTFWLCWIWDHAVVYLKQVRGFHWITFFLFCILITFRILWSNNWEIKFNFSLTVYGEKFFYYFNLENSWISCECYMFFVYVFWITKFNDNFMVCIALDHISSILEVIIVNFVWYIAGASFN